MIRGELGRTTTRLELAIRVTNSVASLRTSGIDFPKLGHCWSVAPAISHSGAYLRLASSGPGLNLSPYGVYLLDPL